MLGSFLYGTLLGVITVGAYTYRTMQVIRGNPMLTLASSLGVSCTYWFSINFIVEDNVSGYIGFSVGAAIATTALSYRNRCGGQDEDTGR